MAQPIASTAPGVVVIDLTDEAHAKALRRWFVHVGPLGRDLEQARAGVRMTLAQHRDAQRLARRPSYRPNSSLYLNPSVSRGWVRRAVARVRSIEERIEAHIQAWAPRTCGRAA